MLYEKAARYPDMQDAVEEIFEGVKLEMVACELCGDYHPPDIHLAQFTPYDPADPEEA